MVANGQEIEVFGTSQKEEGADVDMMELGGVWKGMYDLGEEERDRAAGTDTVRLARAELRQRRERYVVRSRACTGQCLVSSAFEGRVSCCS